MPYEKLFEILLFHPISMAGDFYYVPFFRITGDGSS